MPVISREARDGGDEKAMLDGGRRRRTDTSRVIQCLILAHSHRGDVSRCVKVPVARGRYLAVCARCLGLYPVLFAMMAIQIGVEARPAGVLDWWITVAGVGPALVDWGLSRLAIWSGNNLSRITTGMLAGGGVSRSLYLYFREPVNEILGVQLMLVCFCVLAVEVARQLQLRRNEPPSEL